jgi:hypothetical protein
MTAADTGQFSMRITPIAKTFAAEIEDIDLRSPLDAGAAAATPSSPTCAPPMTRSTRKPRRRSKTSLPSTRGCSPGGLLGFTDFTPEERAKFARVRQHRSPT